MFKKIPLFSLLLIIPISVYATDYAKIIENRDYNDLKQALYKEQPDVLNRSNGFSILDLAIAKKDKRSAIIIADYNNSSYKEKQLKNIELEILNLSDELSSSHKDNNKINDKLISLKHERDKLKATIKKDGELKNKEDSVSHLKSRITALEKILKKTNKLDELTKIINELSSNKNNINSILVKINSIEQIINKFKEKEGDLYKNKDINIKVSNLEKSLNEIKMNKNINFKMLQSKIKELQMLVGKSGDTHVQNDPELKSLVDKLNMRVTHIEKSMMPIDLKSATLNSKALFEQSISLKQTK